MPQPLRQEVTEGTELGRPPLLRQEVMEGMELECPLLRQEVTEGMGLLVVVPLRNLPKLKLVQSA